MTEADYSDGVWGSVRRAVIRIQKVIGVSRLRIVRFCKKELRFWTLVCMVMVGVCLSRASG